jgi:uncharacterized membrane protein
MNPGTSKRKNPGMKSFLNIPDRGFMGIQQPYAHGLQAAALMVLQAACKLKRTGGVMAACPKCGSTISDDSSFCNVCGAAVTSAPPATPPNPAETANAGLSSNAAAALSYLLGLITGIIFLVLDPYKKDEFVRFHAFQSIFFNVALIVFSILWSMVAGIMLSILHILGALFGLIGGLIYLAFFVFWLFLMYKAYNKQRFMIPFIGDLAAKQAAKEP